MAFLGSSCRETAKKAIKQIEGKRRQGIFFFSQMHFFGQKLLTWTSPNFFWGVFELPMLRNAQKRHNKKTKQKEGTMAPHSPFSGYLPDIRRFQKKSLRRLKRPLWCTRGGRRKKEEENQCMYVLYSAWNLFRRAYDIVIIFIAFLSPPYRETPKNAIKRNCTKSARGKM